MSFLNPFFCIPIYLIAFVTGKLILKFSKVDLPIGRTESIDGLRGILALSVFICHSSALPAFVTSGVWETPKSNLYSNFGSISVSFFFMITSFLFISKLLNSKEKKLDWVSLYISRIFRIVPMYFVSVILIFVSVMFIDRWVLQVDSLRMVKSLVGYTLFFSPLINNSEFTIVLAGVIWSLRYEWLFYFSLPLIGLLILKQKNLYAMAFSLIFCICFYFFQPIEKYFCFYFIAGAIPAVFNKYIKVNASMKKYLDVFIIVCFYFILNQPSSANIISLVLCSIVFIFFTSGNSVFRILKNPVLKFLGEIAYSTYLLHSILLFNVFYFGFGFEFVKYSSPIQYWLVVYFMTPFLILFSFLGYYYIEKPFMQKSKSIIQSRKILNYHKIE